MIEVEPIHAFVVAWEFLQLETNAPRPRSTHDKLFSTQDTQGSGTLSSWLIVASHVCSRTAKGTQKIRRVHGHVRDDDNHENM